MSKGFSLIELVLSMTIISIAILGTLLAINTAAMYSADPMATYQGISIAESYLAEIMTKDFPITPCPAGTRSTYTNVCNYNGLNEQPTDQTGTAIPGLSGFTVQVNVDSATASLGSPSLTSGTQVVRINVTVSHLAMTPMTFTAYRTSY